MWLLAGFIVRVLFSIDADRLPPRTRDSTVERVPSACGARRSSVTVAVNWKSCSRPFSAVLGAIALLTPSPMLAQQAPLVLPNAAPAPVRSAVPNGEAPLPPPIVTSPLPPPVAVPKTAAPTPEKPRPRKSTPAPAIERGAWPVRAGDDLRAVLTRWGASAGWSVRWASEYSYGIGATYTFRGSFKAAVGDLILAMQTASPPPIVTFYSQNRALVVSDTMTGTR